MKRPPFSELPVIEGTEERHCWDLFGRGDQLGALNTLVPEATLAALTEPRRGHVFSLNLPLDEPIIETGTRTGYTYREVVSRTGRADVLDNFFLQCSTQWDSLRHIRYRQYGYFGGRQEADLDAGGVLGIDLVTQHGIVTRGLLVDVPREKAAAGEPWDPVQRTKIDVAFLAASLDRHGLEPRDGDVLLVRTGWLAWYSALEPSHQRAFRIETSCGLDPAREMAEWLWDSGFVGVATDNHAVEVLPFDRTDGWLHPRLLALLGILMGEWWDLEALADDCANDGVYSGLLVSAPLRVPRGAGSPANAYMVK